MLQLRVYGRLDTLTDVGRGLEDRGTAVGVALAHGVRRGQAVLTAEVRPGSADAVLEFLRVRGIAQEDLVLARLDDVRPVVPEHHDTSLIWADVLGQARVNARPAARYLVFMMAAGLIAGWGVIEANAILIVGAMAVSPDLLPIVATCVGLAGRRARLARRALATVAVGLGATCLMACALGACLNLLDALPKGFSVGESVLSGLTTVNDATVGVALAAGVAGMLALETRASSAVGVAISITTIPAAAYLGVALGVGEVDRVLGALAVLGTNVTMMLLSGTLTLLLQRRLGPG